MIRRIGIDFGTSTTVLRVKNYEDDGITPIQDRLGTQAVQFRNSQTVPTLVRIFQDGRENLWGTDAEMDRPRSRLIMNFKMDLVSDDPEKQIKAKKLTEGFFQYLYDHFKELNDTSCFGDPAQRIETLVSYPVNWSAESSGVVIDSAKKAHFPNVTGMNEAKAAVISAVLQNQSVLQQIINDPESSHRLLLIDMGAGTTDIIYGECSYFEGKAEWNTILCWPKEGSSGTCGGREIDALMKSCIEKILRNYGEKTGETESYLKRLNNDMNLPLIRRWKEEDVSGELNRGQPVTTCAVATNCTGYELDEINPIDKSAIEELLSDYIGDLHGLIQGCIDHTESKGADIEGVILVGGGSQWYFVKNLLSGKAAAGKKIDLPLISQHPERVILMPIPQVSVAQGLVLSFLPVQKEKRPASVSIPEEESFGSFESIIQSAEEKDSNKTDRLSDGIRNIGKFLNPYSKRIKQEISDADIPSLAQNAKERIITATSAIAERMASSDEIIDGHIDITSSEHPEQINEKKRVSYSELLRRELLSADFSALDHDAKERTLVVDKSFLYLFSGKYPTLYNFMSLCEIEDKRIFCLFYHDGSIFKTGGDSGLLFTNIGVIWRNEFDVVKFVLWKDCISARADKNSLILQTPVEEYSVACSFLGDQECSLLADIADRTAQRVTDNVTDDARLPDPFIKPRACFQNFAAICKKNNIPLNNAVRIIAANDDRLDADRLQNLKTFLRRNHFPMDEDYYLWIDNFAMKNGWGNGTAIGAHGLAIRDKVSAFLLWDDIDGFRKFGNVIYVDNRKKPGVSFRIDLKTDQELLSNSLLDVLEKLRADH